MFEQILIYIYFFSPPFTAYNQRELAEKIREGKYRRIPFRYSEELNVLLSKMLNLKVKELLNYPLIVYVFVSTPAGVLTQVH